MVHARDTEDAVIVALMMAKAAAYSAGSSAGKASAALYALKKKSHSVKKKTLTTQPRIKQFDITRSSSDNSISRNINTRERSANESSSIDRKILQSQGSYPNTRPAPRKDPKSDGRRRPSGALQKNVRAQRTASERNSKTRNPNFDAERQPPYELGNIVLTELLLLIGQERKDNEANIKILQKNLTNDQWMTVPEAVIFGDNIRSQAIKIKATVLSAGQDEFARMAEAEKDSVVSSVQDAVDIEARKRAKRRVELEWEVQKLLESDKSIQALHRDQVKFVKQQRGGLGLVQNRLLQLCDKVR
jgi:hypothetical protein